MPTSPGRAPAGPIVAALDREVDDMNQQSAQARLNGREAALLVGVLFALADWPFEQPAAKALLTPHLRDRAQLLSEGISERWQTRLQEAGLWDSPTGMWTPELIRERSKLSDGLIVDESEIELALAAVDASELEFAHNWGEFCTVIPGAIDWYGLEPEDLARLRARLFETLRS